jgi:hypothetical protein
MEILTHLLGSWHNLVTYLSKQVDAVSQSWLPCLYALVATAILEVKQTNLLWEKDSSSSPLCFKV